MKHLVYILVCCAVCLALASCTPDNPPQPSPSLKVDTVFTHMKVKNHGKYYSTIPQRVFSLDLYSSGIQFDSLGYMQGSGTNLYFSDIFLPDSAKYLLDGTYTIDTTALAFTTVPGQNFEGGVTGAYLLLIQEAELKKIYYFKSGSFTVSHPTDSTCHIEFHLLTTDNQTFGAIYNGHS